MLKRGFNDSYNVDQRRDGEASAHCLQRPITNGGCSSDTEHSVALTAAAAAVAAVLGCDIV